MGVNSNRNSAQTGSRLAATGLKEQTHSAAGFCCKLPAPMDASGNSIVDPGLRGRHTRASQTFLDRPPRFLFSLRVDKQCSARIDPPPR